MTHPLNRTLGKTSVPRIADAVDRPRLFKQLDVALERRALWLAAPPGYGKTTLIASYLEHRSRSARWLQLDAGDGDPATFVDYLSVLASDSGRSLPKLSPEYLSDVAGFARRFLRPFLLALPPDCVLVLDNYQEIPEHSPVNAFLAVVIEELPPGMNLVVISRRDPPEETIRQRANALLGRFDWQLLKLEAPEARQIASGTPASTVNRIWEITGGWPAGFRLALESLRHGSRPSTSLVSAAREEVFTYFASEVFAALQEEEQRMLCLLSLFPRLTPSLAQDLCDTPAAGNLLEELFRTHLFCYKRSPADGAATEAIYEFHALFRDFLEGRFVAAIPSDARKRLMRKAAELLDAREFTREALEILARCEAWDLAVPMLLRDAPQLAAQGRWQVLAERIALLPGAVVDVNGWTLYWRGSALLQVNPRVARQDLERSYALFELQQDVTGRALAISGILWALSLEVHSSPEMLAWLPRLESILAKPELLPPAVQLVSYSGLQLAAIWVKPDHPMLATAADRLMQLLDGEIDLHQKVYTATFLLQYLTMAGDLELGRVLIAKTDHAIAGTELSPLNRGFWHAMRGYAIAHFDLGAARESLDVAIAISDEHGLQALGFLARVTLSCQKIVYEHDPVSADRILTELSRHIPSDRIVDRGYLTCARCWAAIALGQYEEAVREADAARTLAAEIPGAFFRVSWIDCTLGAYLLVGDTTSAREALRTVKGELRDSWIGNHEWVVRALEAELARQEGREAEALDLFRSVLIACRDSIPRQTVVRFVREPLAQMFALACERGVERPTAARFIREWRIDAPDGADETWPYAVRIETFGRFRVEIDDRELQTGRKTPALLFDLLKFVAAAGGADTAISAVLDALWKHSDGDAANNAFANALHRLRKTIVFEDALLSRDGKLRLNPAKVRTDGMALERIADIVAGTTRSDTALPPLDPDRLTTQLFSIYRGHFLVEDDALPQFVAARARFRIIFVATVIGIADAYQAQRRQPAVAELLRRALLLEPAAEILHRRLMIALRDMGERAEALAAYGRCRDAVIAAFGVPPSPETDAIFRELGGR
ncbi:MAG: hypothetical protein JNL33_15585 [Betaproteobacteria bacterium]|nr:hypothetical protein [Betaproteobacteria bacterium]